MDKTKVIYQENSIAGTAFKITNNSDSPQNIYLNSLTLESFPRNIDETNNIFMWIEERPTQAENTLDPILLSNNYIVIDNDGMPPTDEDSNNFNIYVLCTLRIQPGLYRTLNDVVYAINTALRTINTRITNSAADAGENDGANAKADTTEHNKDDAPILPYYSPVLLGEVTIVFDQNNKTPSSLQFTITKNSNYDTVNQIVLALPGFDFANNNEPYAVNDRVTGFENNFAPPVCRVDEHGSLTVPARTSEDYWRVDANRVYLHNAGYSSNSLLAHQIDFDNNLTTMLSPATSITLVKEDFMLDPLGNPIRTRCNGYNYIEYLLSRNIATQWNVLLQTIGDKQSNLRVSFARYPLFPCSSKYYIKYSNDNSDIEHTIENMPLRRKIASTSFSTTIMTFPYKIIEVSELMDSLNINIPLNNVKIPVSYNIKGTHPKYQLPDMTYTPPTYGFNAPSYKYDPTGYTFNAPSYSYKPTNYTIDEPPSYEYKPPSYNVDLDTNQTYVDESSGVVTVDESEITGDITPATTDSVTISPVKDGSGNTLPVTISSEATSVDINPTASSTISISPTTKDSINISPTTKDSVTISPVKDGSGNTLPVTISSGNKMLVPEGTCSNDMEMTPLLNDDDTYRDYIEVASLGNPSDVGGQGVITGKFARSITLIPTLEIKIESKNIPLNKYVTLDPHDTVYIYVTGDIHANPLQKTNHYLVYTEV